MHGLEARLFGQCVHRVADSSLLLRKIPMPSWSPWASCLWAFRSAL